MSRKRILILTSWYPGTHSDFSGIFIREQALALHEKYDLKVLAIKVDYSTFRPFFSYTKTTNNASGFEETILSVDKSFPVYNQFNFLMTSVQHLTKEYKQWQPDLIHCHVSYPAGVVGVIVAKKLNIPCVVTEHTGGFTGLFRSPLHKILILWALRKAHLVTTVSADAQRIMGQYINKKIQVLPNILNASRFKIGKSHTGATHLGFLGGLDTDIKGLDILLEALKSINTKNVMVHIGGQGQLLNAYKKMAEEFGLNKIIKFYGVIHPNNVPAFMNKLDIFVLPSRKESFGVVLLEAMACGLPVIATKCGGPEDIITPETGLLVENKSVLALQHGIELLIRDRDKYNSVQIRKHVIQKFGKEAFLKRIENLYESI